MLEVSRNDLKLLIKCPKMTGKLMHIDVRNQNLQSEVVSAFLTENIVVAVFAVARVVNPIGVCHCFEPGAGGGGGRGGGGRGPMEVVRGSSAKSLKKLEHRTSVTTDRLSHASACVVSEETCYLRYPYGVFSPRDGVGGSDKIGLRKGSRFVAHFSDTMDIGCDCQMSQGPGKDRTDGWNDISRSRIRSHEEMERQPEGLQVK